MLRRAIRRCPRPAARTRGGRRGPGRPGCRRAGGVEDRGALLDQEVGVLGRLGVLDDPLLGAALLQLVQVGDHPLDRAAAGADAADRGDLGAEGEDRFDLQGRSDQGLGGADPTAAAQVLEGVEAEPHLQARAGLAGCLDHGVQRLALLGGAGGGDDHAAEPAGAGLGVDHLDPPGQSLLGEGPRRLAGALAGAGEAGGDVDRDDVAAGGGQRLELLEEVADRGL